MAQQSVKRKASQSIPAHSEPRTEKQPNVIESHLVTSATRVPPLHDPNQILNGGEDPLARSMSIMSLASLDSMNDDYSNEMSMHSELSMVSHFDSERSMTGFISEHSGIFNSDRSSLLATPDLIFDTPMKPKEERPAQPEEERQYYEQIWSTNFQKSTALPPVVPDTAYIPQGEQGQLVRISGHSLASGSTNMNSSTKQPYVIFRLEVECQANGKRWTVYRRYHDFRELSSQLKSQGFRIPALPSRRFGIRRSFDTLFLRKRQSDLEKWLKELLVPPARPTTAPRLGMSHFVRTFLTKDANQPPALETGSNAFSYSDPDQRPSASMAAMLQESSQGHSSRRTAADFMARTHSRLSDGGVSHNSKISALFLNRTEPGKQSSKPKAKLERTNSDPRLQLERVPSFEQLVAKPTTDDFEPLRFIGKGSFGRVLLVRKKAQGELFAMKILTKQDVVKKSQVEHTRTERSVLGSIDHPFIVRLHYAFQTTHQLYFILDYCPGGDLFFHLTRIKCFPESIARFYAAEITLALVHLHEKGIVYRDLKPENIMLDVHGHVKLADFGLAKTGITGRLDGTNTLCGTPEYLPPEILNKKGHGTAVDWWNLGMVLYELLTGRPPWYTTDRETLYQRLRSSPLEFPAGLSVEAMDLIAGLLERDPSQRLRATEVLVHPFFKEVAWEALLNREVEPEFRPCQYTDPLDAVNFEDDFTRLPVLDAMDDVSGSSMAVTPSARSSVSGRTNSCRTMSYTFQGFTYDGDVGLDDNYDMSTPPSL
ncbi:AGC protein kinase, variant [Saprolegnia diclina VS20]|uniref:AGC protein kinase, variant n=1 Tax=Saprolegnia diclina (strain VS20) TaxID=1156394 RepID=T0S0B0_SAPDV|nr:AGC protein kinase, variant [Saprolegnia diclina VS20]EQC36037.1 AGC protein kinase, variant [Saprolegnia diclina VS20]|eukprot:XP_008610799.1 AGC protein kinase, variant [Saprolegnia diclina VS20]